MVSLSELLKQCSERNRSATDLQVLSVNNKYGFIAQSDQFEDREVASDDTTNYKVVEKGMFAYNPARINVGSIALYEMDGYCPGKNYKELADKILKNLSGPDYKAKVGENGNFILMHSVGSIPHGAEIDVPLNYADYYYEEALIRKRNIENNQPFSFVNE